MTYDVSKIRGDFPILTTLINEKPLVYLDNAATTQKPRVVIDAMTHYYEHDNANVHRGVHTLSEQATQAFEAARGKIQHYINAKDRREVVFMRGTTEAINCVAHSFLTPRLQPEEQIVLTGMEHHSNIVPWQIVAKRTVTNLRIIPVKDNGELDLEKLDAMLTKKVKFLAITHVSNVLGTINPLREIIQLAHDKGILVLVDGSQAGPHVPIDVQALDCDFYTLSAHKMYGPTGIGALYAKYHLLDSMIPYQTGGEMVKQVDFEKTEYNDLPYRFEAGTPNIAGAIGFGAAIDYLNQVGLSQIAAHEQALLKYATEQIQQIPGLRLIGTAPEKVGVLTFTLAGVHPHDIGTILNSVGVAVRAGHHCAMPLMKRFGVDATVRASLAMYSTREEIDSLVKALHQVHEVFV
jgi:cysteine desulfurase/selenocysteine lyase